MQKNDPSQGRQGKQAGPRWKFAAIDIGSNAVRLLLSLVIECNSRPIFKKEALIRIPIRLGEDSFTRKKISKAKANGLVKTMIAFRHLIDAYQAIDFMACATSAMREAKNGEEIVQRIETESGIKLEIVDGKREAEIIYSNHFEDYLGRNKTYLYVDVGGGSTELTLYANRKSIASKSFNIGTVRLLQNIVPEESWTQMRFWIKEYTRNYRSISAIGSGGNINKIFRISRVDDRKPLTIKRLREIYEYLKSFTMQERIEELNLRPDRADVILPAARIFLTAMISANIKKIYVPQIGLADGLVHLLYDRFKNQPPS